MKSTWKHIYPWIASAVGNLDSMDMLLSQAVELLAETYHTDCLLWTGLETNLLNTLQVYGTAKALKSLENLSPDEPTVSHLSETQDVLSVSSTIRPITPDSLPIWLLEQQQSPHLTQLETGDLIVPIASQGNVAEAGFMGIAPIPSSLQLIVQFRCRTSVSPLAAHLLHQPHSTYAIQGWSGEELATLEVVCSQLGLAYNALYWRQRLEQSRRQTALVGRIARLLNSSLNSDEIVERIVAELGQGLQCDRSILVDLRHSPVNVLSVWNHPDQRLVEFPYRQLDPALWCNVVEMFQQGGASYLQLGLTDMDPDPLVDWLKTIGATSVLMVPLFTQDNFFGTVALLSYFQERIYQLDELQTIRQVADHAAIALTNAQQYQNLWHKQEALRLQNKSLQREATCDDLTHLLNRRSLERELGQLSSHSSWIAHSIFSVIVCDIDYFKLVNDTYGHRVGDEVLQILSQRLQKQLRRETPVYRYGGEEFVVILMDAELNKAIDVAERLRQAVRITPIQTSVGSITVTASFGVAQRNIEQDREAWNVLYRADQALYDAKRQGRDRVKALQ